MSYCIALQITCVVAEMPRDLFANKKILVIGGTGYLGRTIVEEVLKYDPQKVTIFSRDEVKHANCIEKFGRNRICSILGDIRNYQSVDVVTRGMDIVFHVAALKRADTLEFQVQEGIATNVIGTANVFNACINNNVDKVLFVSTDKSCFPINAYGATKMLDEKIFTNYDKTATKTTFVVTRFGNILESTGSVIPFFVEKIRKGESISLTDERMTRFIIDRQEAFDVMCTALHYGIGGEIFIKKLPALRVADLIDVLKKRYNASNEVTVAGLRPGEKFHEILISAFEKLRAYAFEDYYIIPPEVHRPQELAMYVTKGRKIEKSDVSDYSSELAVISQEELAKKFESLNI
jgi:UDP-glucose 4-epimerase